VAVKIAYGVLGYGQGHATRALSVLPLLERHHEVMILSSGDALHALSPTYPVYKVPNLRYEYNEAGKRCLFRTGASHWSTVWDALFGGPALDGVMRALRDFAPDVAVCDCDPFVHTAAARLGIPRVSFDHFGVLAFCKIAMPWVDRLCAARDVATYRRLIGNPQRIVVSSFFDAPPKRSGVTLVPALVRDEVRRAKASAGEHLLVYLNNGAHQLTPHVEEALRGLRMPVIVYGTERRGDDGRLSFRAPARAGFVNDLARSIAVFSTAGNQLVAEALHLGKPMLVMPENTVEQRTNARAIEAMGFGRALDHERLTTLAMRGFLSEVPRYRASARGFARDGTNDAAAALLRFAAELSQKKSVRAPLRVVRAA
jgi:uncharacterized protein (TIGR00661 family)